ncbi:MAG: hypothetical protein ACQES2_02260 [Pseudomonadota bacterium]
MNRTAIFQFSTIAAAALLTACSGGTGNGASAKAGANSESVADPVTIDESNKAAVAASSERAINEATEGGLADFAGTVGVASFGKSQIANKQSPMEAVQCDSGSGSVTETETQLSGTFNNCVYSESDGQGGSAKLSIDGSFTFTEDANSFSGEFDALTYGFIFDSQEGSGEFGFIFFGLIEGTDDGTTQTTSFDNYGINFYAEVDGQENAEGHFRYHTGTVEYGYGNSPQTLDVNDLQFSTNYAGVDESDNNVTVDRFSITMNTDETLVYSNGSTSAPTAGIIVIEGTNQMSIDFGTGNPATADVTLNGTTEEVQVTTIGF